MFTYSSSVRSGDENFVWGIGLNDTEVNIDLFKRDIKASIFASENV
jgi:hypothetical protein